jgi:hypothetical protein
MAYLAFLGAAARVLFALAARDRALGLGLAAVFLTLVIHSLFYAGFFEDPITWGVLAIAVAALLRPPRRQASREVDGTGPAGEVATLEASSAERPTPLAADRVES